MTDQSDELDVWMSVFGWFSLFLSVFSDDTNDDKTSLFPSRSPRQQFP